MMALSLIATLACGAAALPSGADFDSQFKRAAPGQLEAEWKAQAAHA